MISLLAWASSQRRIGGPGARGETPSSAAGALSSPAGKPGAMGRQEGCPAHGRRSRTLPGMHAAPAPTSTPSASMARSTSASSAWARRSSSEPWMRNPCWNIPLPRPGPRELLQSVRRCAGSFRVEPLRITAQGARRRAQLIAAAGQGAPTRERAVSPPRVAAARPSFGRPRKGAIRLQRTPMRLGRRTGAVGTPCARPRLSDAAAALLKPPRGRPGALRPSRHAAVPASLAPLPSPPDVGAVQKARPSARPPARPARRRRRAAPVRRSVGGVLPCGRTASIPGRPSGSTSGAHAASVTPPVSAFSVMPP